MEVIEAIRLELSKAKNVYDVINCAEDWRSILLQKERIELRKYQVPFSDQMIRFRVGEGSFGNEIVSLWCRQSGKTETVADTVLALGTFYMIFLNEDFSCGLFAPVESMITHVTRNRLRQRFKMVKRWLEKDAGIEQIAGEGLTSSTFVLRSLVTDKEMTVRSLSAGESASIIGESFSLMIIEQSELIDSLKLKTDIFPMGAAKGGVRVMTGTTSPYFRNEYFKEAIEKWNENPLKNHSTADWVEIVEWVEAAAASPAYSRYVHKEKDKLGEDSIEFQTQYCLKWVGIALKFIGWERLANLEKDYVFLKDNLRFFGIDVARAGDSTVVTPIEIDGAEIHILGWLELEGLDFETQVPRIADFLKTYDPLRFGYVDIAGLGSGIYDMLKKKLYPWARVDSYYGNEKLNSQIYQDMDREFNHNRIFYPKTVVEEQRKNKARFIGQLLDLERRYKGFTLKLEAPRLKGRHDDYPISLALAIAALKEKAFKGGVTSVDF